MTLLILTTGVAFVASVLLTPFVRELARRLGIVDHPDKHRKLHERSIPLGGGVAVAGAVGLAVLAVLFFGGRLQQVILRESFFIIGFSLAVLAICLVGLADDRFGLRGRQKLTGQIVAASLVVASGLIIQDIQIFSWEIQLGLLAAPFTIFWVLGAINALNLLDGVDGLATSVGIVLSFGLAIIAFMNGHQADAMLALAVAGALLGFLCYNFPPASIFLGDAGSMLIGLVLGVLAIRSSLKGPATIAMAAPTAIWAIPIFDVSMAILRRKLTGRSVYTTDRGHLHHTLMRRGYSNVKTLAFVGMLCCVTAVGALLSVYKQSEILAVASVAIVVCTLVLCRMFGHHECLLLLRRLKGFLLSFVPVHRQTSTPSAPVCSRLQGSHSWDELWGTLTRLADKYDLSAVQLNVNLPAIQEEYHATWRRKSTPHENELCRTDIPLIAHNATIGRLRITGSCNNGSAHSWMTMLVAGLKPFEQQMLDLVDQRPPRAVASTQSHLLAARPHHQPDQNTGQELQTITTIKEV